MDGIVILLALTLNPIAERRRQRQSQDVESDIHEPVERSMVYQHEQEGFAALEIETRVPSRVPSREKEDKRPDDLPPY